MFEGGGERDQGGGGIVIETWGSTNYGTFSIRCVHPLEYNIFSIRL